ncbi:hypothetical protein J6590_006167 [Homalodisca vitripennis]|nr:hypothetical protein J6590_006167 [Homalodisca vitripennis]
MTDRRHLQFAQFATSTRSISDMCSVHSSSDWCGTRHLQSLPCSRTLVRKQMIRKKEGTTRAVKIAILESSDFKIVLWPPQLLSAYTILITRFACEYSDTEAPAEALTPSGISSPKINAGTADKTALILILSEPLHRRLLHLIHTSLETE